MNSIRIALTIGEPAGIGREIILETCQQHEFRHIEFIIIGDKNLFSCELPENVRFHHIDFGENIHYGICKTDYADKILQTIEIGVDYCINNQADALVTAPINKNNIHAIKSDFYGHTDYIAELIFQKTGQYYQPIMMLTCPELRTVPITIHIPLKDVAEILTSDMIFKKVIILYQALKDDYKINLPNIQISGLNPHAGDGGIIGREEENILMPAIEKLRSCGVNISNPVSADIMFHQQARLAYDVAVCMYHDQALIPVKTLGFDVGVNVTLGLPIIRTSPDHGTALDIAGKNIANSSAMISAVQEAIKLAKNRTKI